MDELLNTPENLSQPQPPKRDLHWIFSGENGLRAGWSILLFLLIFIVLSMVITLLISIVRVPVQMGQSLKPGTAFTAEIIQFSAVLLATAIMAQGERKKASAYGYAGRANVQRFVWGVIWGFIAISVLVGVLWKTHLLAFDASSLTGKAVWRYAVEWGLVFIFTGLFEETFLRGYLQYTLARGIGFWWAALLLSAGFGLFHKGNPGESPVGLFSAGAIGFIFCISLWYTGSLWWAIGFHAAWDWGESFFYGTANSGVVAKGHLLSTTPTGALLWSGGTTGPEGSLLVVPLLFIIALLMWLWWGKRTVSPFRMQNASREI